MQEKNYFKTISMIATMDRSRLIAVNNEIPWNIPEDYNLFNTLVKNTNSICLVGRTAYERALKYRAVPNSKLIVMTNSIIPSVRKENGITIYYVSCIEGALKITDSQNSNLMIAGGFKMYSSFAHLATNFHVTLVDRSYPIGEELRFPFCPREESKDWIIVDIKKLANGVSYYHFARSVINRGES
jgi:dihydrofolate reductase